MKHISTKRRVDAATLVEMAVASTVTLMVTASVIVGSAALQKSFQASQHHARSQTEQARILDQISMDLRRALTVSVTGTGESQRIELTVPDFYTPAGEPRDPVITKNGEVIYGDAAMPTSIAYFKSGKVIYRELNGAASAVATDVQDFALDYTDNGKQAVGVSVSFTPRYQMNAAHDHALRAGTATFATTLLRNKRRN